MKQHTVCITGAAGYVGAMLVARFAARPDVVRVIGIDKEPLPDLLAGEPKLVYLHTNTADPGWEDEVRPYEPTIVIHTAWHIREVYGNRPLTWRWNIEGSDRVFDFAYATPSVARLIHFSTVASYGAFASNTVEHRFTEDEPFRKTDYLYAEEKRITEEHLAERFVRASRKVPTVVLRPAAITGPRGRFMRIRFGLQSALAGQLTGSPIYRIVAQMTRVVPVTPRWVRQFIHEDDVAAIVELVATTDAPSAYEVFNICPPGSVVRGADMARAVGKRMVRVLPWMVRIPFALLWHASRGVVPTARGSWKGYSYPIAVDGSKISRAYGYTYQYEGLDAFQYTDGMYERHIPEAQRNPKP